MTMNLTIKTLKPPPFDRTEILRYAGCREADETLSALLGECLEEAEKVLSYKLCYWELPLRIEDESCDFGILKLSSKKLSQNLSGSSACLLFAATVGIGLDRLIARYGRIAPTKALLMQAVGAERIEALCDTFCAEMAKEKGVGLRPRFSPGYGDLPLESQREIFALLECEKHLGLCLTDSLLMSPSKSVTAFLGIGGNQ